MTASASAPSATTVPLSPEEAYEAEAVHQSGVGALLVIADLLQQMERIAEAGQKYQSAIEATNAVNTAWFDALPLVAWATDSEERFVIANRHLLTMLGDYMGEDWQGKTVEDLFGPEIAQTVREANARVDALNGAPLTAIENGQEGRRWQVTRFAFSCCPCSESETRFHGGWALLLDPQSDTASTNSPTLLKREACNNGG